MAQQTDVFSRFLTTYHGRGLLEKHSLDEHGQWEVYGEDPNCDLGGSHSCPYLGLLEGTLLDVIVEAVEMPGFWQWGGGGEIKKAAPDKVRQVGKPSRITDKTLFALVEQKTHDGKIEWMHCHGPQCSPQAPDGFSDCPDSKRLTGRVPGNGMVLSLTWDGVDTLSLTISGEEIVVGSGSEIAALRRRILLRPVEDAAAEAARILQNL